MKLNKRGIPLVPNVEVEEINNVIEVKFEKSPEKYVEEILSMEICKLFLPVSFIKDGDMVTAQFKTDGFTRLSAINSLAVTDIFSIIVSVFYGLKDGENHYIFPDEYEINCDTVFINKDFSDIKMIFNPPKAEKTGQEKVVEFIEELKKKCSNEGIPYLNNAAGYIKTGSSGYRAIIHHLESLRREVYLCGVE